MGLLLEPSTAMSGTRHNSLAIFHPRPVAESRPIRDYSGEKAKSVRNESKRVPP